MTARFMERSMALLYHVGFEKWAFLAVLIIYFVVSGLGTRGYRVLLDRRNTIRVWMGSLRELSTWGMLVAVAVMMYSGLVKDFAIHREVDAVFLGLLILHAFTGFWFYMSRLRKSNK
jgi:hypothetical protein